MANACAAVLHAEEVLRDRGGSLSPDELRRAMRVAGYSELEADTAAAKRYLELRRLADG